MDKKIAALIKDEKEAIEGYDVAIAYFKTLGDNEEVNRIIDQLQHIREEEYEHIDELQECQEMLDAYTTLTLDEDAPVKKGPREKCKYSYNGYLFYNGRPYRYSGETVAVSDKQALNNIKYKGGRDVIGIDLGKHIFKVDADKRYLKREYVIDSNDSILNSFDGIGTEEDLERSSKRCPECNRLLDDSGRCPVCDEGEEDY